MPDDATHVGPVEVPAEALEGAEFALMSSEGWIVFFAENASAKRVVVGDVDGIVLVDYTIFDTILLVTMVEDVFGCAVFLVGTLDIIQKYCVYDGETCLNHCELVIRSSRQGVSNDVLFARAVDDVEVELLEVFAPADLTLREVGLGLEELQGVVIGDDRELGAV
jgi:hypothetical protein